MNVSTLIALLKSGCRHSSVRRATTGQVEHRACRETAFIAQQPADERDNLLHFREPIHRDLRLHVVDEALRQLLEQWGVESRRCDYVCNHAGRREFFTERLREPDDTRLRGGI